MRRALSLVSALAVIATTASCSNEPRNADRSSREAYYEQMVQRYQTNPAHGRVVFIGDSITWRGRWNEALPNCDLVMRAIEGETTEGVLARIEEINRVGAEVAIIMLGANDVLQSDKVDATFERYSKIIDQLDEGTDILIISTTLQSSKQAEKNKKVLELNNLLERKCASGVCSFVNLNSQIAPQGSILQQYTTDGLHLTQAAYERWRGLVTDRIGC